VIIVATSKHQHGERHIPRFTVVPQIRSRSPTKREVLLHAKYWRPTKMAPQSSSRFLRNLYLRLTRASRIYFYVIVSVLARFSASLLISLQHAVCGLVTTRRCGQASVGNIISHTAEEALGKEARGNESLQKEDPNQRA
jgi:hypothetical protein